MRLWWAGDSFAGEATAVEYPFAAHSFGLLPAFDALWLSWEVWLGAVILVAVMEREGFHCFLDRTQTIRAHTGRARAERKMVCDSSVIGALVFRRTKSLVSHKLRTVLAH